MFHKVGLLDLSMLLLIDVYWCGLLVKRYVVPKLAISVLIGRWSYS